MKIQNINLINFAWGKNNKKTRKNQDYRNKPFVTNFPKTNIFEPYYPGKSYDFDKFENKKLITASPDGNIVLSKETGFNSTALELIEFDNNKIKTTRFKTTKKYGEKSECSYKITENGKSKTSVLNWDFPGKNFNYKGSPKDMPRLKKALQHLRNTIHEKENIDDFGYIREVNFQFKAAIGYLQEEIENQKK